MKNVSNSQIEMISPIYHRLKPMAETQNLFKQVGEASFNVFEHVFCNRLGIPFPGKLAK
jgi:hypothetical protein